MSLLAFTLVAQLATTLRPSPPVLAFPEPGLDDSAAYAGYATRFHRDADGNTLQVYLDRGQGRIVHLLANAENESVGVSARGPDGTPAPMRWGTTPASVWQEGRRRRFRYELEADGPTLHLGRFVLGSMRIERDVQYLQEHRRAFTDAPYALPEFVSLAEALATQPAATRRAALQRLGAASVAQLRQRIPPRLVANGRGAVAIIEQLSLDGRDTLQLHIAPRGDTRLAAANAREVVLEAAAGAPVRLQLTISTTGRSLSPLTRHEIFTDDFLAWARDVEATGDATRARWIERQIVGVELLASREKLMAGLPTYATYFGRDMLLSALMMQPVWQPAMNEFVLAAALRKLSPSGEVSHEEALGGQALREAAAEAARHFRAADSLFAREGNARAADSLRARALIALRDRRLPRENYHMVDDEFQLPLVAARYLSDTRVSEARKRAWLLGREGTRTRLSLLLEALGVVADRSEPYARNPTPTNFVAFAPRDATAGTFDGAPRWFAQSWRDSGAGYANGKFAMDVNAIYIPHALVAMQRIVGTLRDLGLSAPLAAERAVRQRHPALAAWLDDSHALASAVRTWQEAINSFVVRLDATEVASRVARRLTAMPPEERTYWRAFPPSGEGLEFLALALDAAGQPIAVANSDPATRLFLDGLMGSPALNPPARRALERDVSLFTREYPEGLLVPAVGPVVANDAYASPTVWQAFVDDAYHSPRVVWGREVNLFLLGVASHLPALQQQPAVSERLRDAAARVRDAVAASGFRSELWSYAFPNGRPQPVRYGSGGDVQLWSTTDLAVQYVWARLPQ